MIYIQNFPFCLWFIQKTPCFIPSDCVVKVFVVSISHIDEVTVNAHSFFFLFGLQLSRYQMLINAAHV